MSNNIIVTVDFDGVVLEKMGGRDWVKQKKSKPEKLSPIRIWIESTWAEINHLWRKPVEGSVEGLKNLKQKGFKILMLTSRKSHYKKATFEWLKRWGAYELYDEFYFNDQYQSAIESKIENMAKIKANWHIDDNRETVFELREKYPQLKVVWLDKAGETKSWSEIGEIVV